MKFNKSITIKYLPFLFPIMFSNNLFSQSLQGNIENLNMKLDCMQAHIAKSSFESLSSYDVSGLNLYHGSTWKKITLPDMPTEAVNTKVINITDDNVYRFYRFQTGEKHLLDYAYGTAAKTSWKNKAWNPSLYALKFNDTWFLPASAEMSQEKTTWDIWGSGVIRSFSHALYPLDSVSVLNRTAKPVCFENGKRSDECWTNFIIKTPLDARLSSIADVETLTNHTVGNNRLVYDLELWGLKSPAIPENCSN